MIQNYSHTTCNVLTVSRTQIVKVELKSSQNPNDPTVMETIIQWVSIIETRTYAVQDEL